MGSQGSLSLGTQYPIENVDFCGETVAPPGTSTSQSRKLRPSPIQHPTRMHRPCFLVIDREYAGNISTRKLVIETAKFNVLTAYDRDEAVGTLERFPNVDGVVLNADASTGAECQDVISRLRAIVPDITIIITSTGAKPICGHQEYYVDSLNPAQLLECLQSLHKEATAEIAKRDPRIPR